MASQRLEIKFLPGTDILVDGFRFLSARAPAAVVLTHFHSDHTTGLTKAYAGPPIICTPVTGDLLVHDFGLPERCVQRMTPDVPFLVHGVELTLLGAMHCPGACLVLARVPRAMHAAHKPGRQVDLARGRHAGGVGGAGWVEAAAGGRASSAVQGILSFFAAPPAPAAPAPPVAFPPPSETVNVLHTGDFRWHPSMAQYPALAALPRLDALLLDTTYCDPKYTFPPRAEAVAMVARVIKEALRADPRCLVVVGAYHIGKEHAYLGAAAQLGLKVYVDEEKRKVLRLLRLPPPLLATLTRDPGEAAVRVAWMGQIRAEALRERMEREGRRSVLGVRPTGWAFRPGGALDRRQTGPVTIVAVPYSEHSSFAELQDCIRTLRPVQIIPTVNAPTAAKAHALLERFKGLTHPTSKGTLNAFVIRRPRDAAPAAPPPSQAAKEEVGAPTRLRPALDPEQSIEGAQPDFDRVDAEGDEDNDAEGPAEGEDGGGSEPEEERAEVGSQRDPPAAAPGPSAPRLGPVPLEESEDDDLGGEGKSAGGDSPEIRVLLEVEGAGAGPGPDPRGGGVEVDVGAVDVREQERLLRMIEREREQRGQGQGRPGSKRRGSTPARKGGAPPVKKGPGAAASAKTGSEAAGTGTGTGGTARTASSTVTPSLNLLNFFARVRRS